MKKKAETMSQNLIDSCEISADRKLLKVEKQPDPVSRGRRQKGLESVSNTDVINTIYNPTSNPKTRGATLEVHKRSIPARKK